jgi:hypothetical protein
LDSYLQQPGYLTQITLRATRCALDTYKCCSSHLRRAGTFGLRVLGTSLRYSPDLSTKEIDSNTQGHQSCDNTRADVERVLVALFLDKADSPEGNSKPNETSERADEDQRSVDTLRIRIHAVNKARYDDSNETEVLKVDCHCDTCPAPIRWRLGCLAEDYGRDENGNEWDDESVESVLGLRCVSVLYEVPSIMEEHTWVTPPFL